MLPSGLHGSPIRFLTIAELNQQESLARNLRVIAQTQGFMKMRKFSFQIDTSYAAKQQHFADWDSAACRRALPRARASALVGWGSSMAKVIAGLVLGLAGGIMLATQFPHLIDAWLFIPSRS